MAHRWISKRRFSALAFMCFSFCMAASHAYSKETSRVTVSVKDVLGAFIPNAHVSFAAVERKQSVEAVTGQNGAVSVDLPAGTYELSVTCYPFLTSKQIVTTEKGNRKTIVVSLQFQNTRIDCMACDSSAKYINLWRPPLDDVWVPFEFIQVLPLNVGSRGHSINPSSQPN